ncbi:MAG: VanZ family protein [Bacteroidales bacterium]|nr:VanZ family protein [Bacteroidales bacterium]MDD3961939.1 VanZ family protein [Bacteroidales bacterium]MDY0285438.1 VanZ family protein [Bacteroidales bacterium]
MTRTKKIFRTLFFIGLTSFLGLLYVPRLPRVPLVFLNGWLRLDYLAHFLFNLVLIYLFLLWQSDQRYRVSRGVGLIIFLAGILFCFATEFTQHLVVPQRAFEIQDLLCNLGGMFTGFMLFLIKSPQQIINQLFK